MEAPSSSDCDSQGYLGLGASHRLIRLQSGICTLCPHYIGQNLVIGPHLNAKGWDIQFLTGQQFSHDGSAPMKGGGIVAGPTTKCFPGTEVGNTGSEFDGGVVT